MSGGLFAGPTASWLYLPAALLLGALHALEPGHAKTMMAGYIVAIHGTARQAVLLGLSAAVSHTLVVWVLALLGLWLGNELIHESAEPYLMIAAGAIAVLIALWLAARVSRQHHHGHHHHHHHHHRHDDETDSAPKLALAGPATTRQIIGFGLSGGLVPCPSAIVVLILCLKVGSFGLGMALVGAFSLGVAATLVAVGVVAALGLSRLRDRGGRIADWLERAPYASSVLVALVGLVAIVQGAWRL